MSSSDVAIVTGAGSGLGQAVALSLAELPLRVIAVGRRLDPLLETASKSAGKVEPVASDVSNATGRNHLCSALNPADRVRFLVHAAGVHAVEPLGSMTSATWRRVLDTNVDARLFLTLDLLPRLRSGSRVLFVGSNSATRPRKSATAYCVSQAASYMLQQCLRIELAPRGIAVGSAVPSPVDTPMIARSDRGRSSGVSGCRGLSAIARYGPAHRTADRREFLPLAAHPDVGRGILGRAVEHTRREPPRALACRGESL
jgi:NAD(P)-dependent dehydrogenase (short-subunit alcohol dehydrogenase family)